MINAGIEIGVKSGTLSVFQGVLPMSYIDEERTLPNINSNGTSASYDFNIPSHITVPMFYVVMDVTGGYLYDFQHLSGTSWRINFYGIKTINMATGGVIQWTEPLVKAGTKFIIGGQRG